MKDFLDILKRRLQNFRKFFNKLFSQYYVHNHILMCNSSQRVKHTNSLISVFSLREDVNQQQLFIDRFVTDVFLDWNKIQKQQKNTCLKMNIDTCKRHIKTNIEMAFDVISMLFSHLQSKNNYTEITHTEINTQKRKQKSLSAFENRIFTYSGAIMVDSVTVV